MELFPDYSYVRLRSRVHGSYLHADEDGVGISLSRQQASLHTAWKVHRLVRAGASFVLFYGAAYGRYLALLPRPADEGGHRAVQRTYDTPEQGDVLWVATRVGDEGRHVLIRHGTHRTWYIGVTVDNDDDRSTHWVVEAIPPRPEPPVLPHPMAPPDPELRRRIVYIQAHGLHCLKSAFIFSGRSVFDLRAHLAGRLRQQELSITMCVRAGSCGRLIPLAIDLPFNEQPIQIVVLTTGSAAALMLQHPEVDAR